MNKYFLRKISFPILSISSYSLILYIFLWCLWYVSNVTRIDWVFSQGKIIPLSRQSEVLPTPGQILPTSGQILPTPGQVLPTPGQLVSSVFTNFHPRSGKERFQTDQNWIVQQEPFDPQLMNRKNGSVRQVVSTISGDQVRNEGEGRIQPDSKEPAVSSSFNRFSSFRESVNQRLKSLSGSSSGIHTKRSVTIGSNTGHTISFQLNSVSDIDKVSRIIFPLAFLITNFLYWTTYLADDNWNTLPLNRILLKSSRTRIEWDKITKKFRNIWRSKNRCSKNRCSKKSMF